MRRPVPLALGLTLLLALAAAGCGSSDDGDTPSACLSGERAYLTALEAAPGAVLLAGETPIGDCLTENQPGGPLETVGTAMVAAATALNAEGRENPDGAAPVRLGYLVGAAEASAEETSGIHAELVRRLEAAATYSPGGRPQSQLFDRGYESGREAAMAAG
jgi:hypothetical protein